MSEYDLEVSSESRLFDITLYEGAVFHFSPKGNHVWQGVEYEEVPCHLTEVGQQAEGKMSRPKFTVANPGGIFTAEVHNRGFENATITRHRISTSDLLADQAVSLSESFRVTKVVQVTSDVIVVECRGALDGANFKLPYRRFVPPEFRHVRLR